MEDESKLLETQEIIDSEIKSFTDNVKRSNRLWVRQTRKSETPFSLVNVANSEYYTFQNCERTMEWFFRVHLANGILTRMLATRGIACITFLEKEHIHEKRESIRFSCKDDNNVFEEMYPFEFIILEDGGNIGIRYQPIDAKRAETVLCDNDVNRIIIISWEEDNDCLADNEPVFSMRSPIRDKVSRCSLKAFFKRYFSEKEYDLYLEKVRGAIKKASTVIGFHTIPQLNSRNVSEYKISIIDTLGAEDYKSISFILNPEKEKERQKKTTVPVLPFGDKDLLLHYYLNQRVYRSLLGKNDFATSFFTSEYLYQTYCEQKNFDYTAIIAGYLKAVEQLVHTILVARMNDEQKPRILIKRRYVSNSNYPEEIRRAFISIPKGKREIIMLPLASSYKDYFDTTLNSMCDCLFSDIDGWRVSDSGRETIKKYLQLFSQDCRNDHFHKHNITDWNEVERIRNNTILCLFCLLGGNIYCEASDEGNKTLGIVDDSFDRLYRTLLRISPAQKRFILTFPNGEVIKAIRLQHQEEEQYNDHGNTLSPIKFVRVDSFDISDYHAIEQDHTSQDEIIITRYNMPKSIECVSYKGKTFLKW